MTQAEMAQAEAESSRAAFERATLGERTRYAAGGERQTALALMFLILLPFTIGALNMVFTRAMDAMWVDFAALCFLTAALCIVLLLISLELMHALRARIVFGRSALSFTLPRNGGPVPMLRYTSQDIPYHAIKSVELRREVFGGKVAPVILRGLTLRTKDNREFVLGHCLEGFDDPGFPFAEIAEKLAARSALQLLDQRTIWRRSRKERALGYISEYDTDTYILDPADIARLNTAHRRLVLGLASAFAAIALIGILADISARAI